MHVQTLPVRQRIENDIPMCMILNGAKSRTGLTKEEKVAGWILDLAKLHDPQPDRKYTILGTRYIQL
jgi:hypothetical protein